MENEVGWINDSSEDGETFIEIQINKPAAGLSISSSSSPDNDMQTTTIFSSASSCFSAYSSVTRLMMKLGCLSIVGVIREKVNVGEKWVLLVIHRRRNKSPLRYYCEGSNNKNEETLTDDSLKAAIAYCNASSLPSTKLIDTVSREKAYEYFRNGSNPRASATSAHLMLSLLLIVATH